MHFSRILPLTAILCALPLPPLTGQTIPMVAVTPDRPATVQGTTKAFRYRDLSSPVKIDLQGTTLSPDASGVAIVAGAEDRIHVVATFANLLPPSSLGREFLTYVLWGISPDGRATNLGEVAVKDGKAELDIMERDKAFGLLVTAEPYFAVTRPSEAVVLENILGSDAQGKVETIEASFALLRRGVYAKELASQTGLRTELMVQLSNVLLTRETARGLVVSLSGKMFLPGKAVLSSAAQDKLVKIAGILSAHKGLKIEADGFTDNTGSDELNLNLSEKRAMVTKDFLVRQGVPADAIIFKGFGNDYPVASNDTESGRLENRRVELVVTGDEPKETIEAP